MISDTHGLLREEAVCALRGADLILHAGDVGSPEILDALTEIAPLFAVRGNVDTGVWAKELPMSAVIEAGSVTIYMLHILKDLEPNSVKTRIQIVVSGHSHAPGQMEKNGVTYINPGSAGPRRFRLPVTLARLDLGIKPWKAQFIELEKKFGSQ